MKNSITFSTLLSLSVFAAGCGEYSKSPEGNMTSLYQHQVNQDTLNKGPVIKYIDKPVETPPQIVYREQAKVGRDAVIISTGTLLTFSEGVKSQFPVRLAVTVPNVKIKLKVSEFAQNITLEESKEAGVYLLTWTPDFYTIPAGETHKTFVAKIIPDIISGDKKTVEILKGLDLSQDFVIEVLPNQELPSAMSLSGLDNEVAEGSITPFSVTMKFPGVDDKSAEKPSLEISYDKISVTEGNSFLEMDGTRHVKKDPSKSAAEYVGNFQWKFNLLFDTKNTLRQTQLAKDGSEMAQADGTRVRFSLKAKGGRNVSTPTKLIQLKIKATPAATPAPTASPSPAPSPSVAPSPSPTATPTPTKSPAPAPAPAKPQVEAKKDENKNAKPTKKPSSRKRTPVKKETK